MGQLKDDMELRIGIVKDFQLSSEIDFKHVRMKEI